MRKVIFRQNRKNGFGQSQDIRKTQIKSSIVAAFLFIRLVFESFCYYVNKLVFRIIAYYNKRLKENEITEDLWEMYKFQKILNKSKTSISKSIFAYSISNLIKKINK